MDFDDESGRPELLSLSLARVMQEIPLENIYQGKASLADTEGQWAPSSEKTWILFLEDLNFRQCGHL